MTEAEPFTDYSVDEKIRSICDQIEAAQVQLEAGRPIDAAAIDQTTADLCTLLGKLSPAQARAQAPRLQALIAHLDTVMVRLEQQKQTVQQDLSALQDRGAAFSAYQNAAKLKETR